MIEGRLLRQSILTYTPNFMPRNDDVALVIIEFHQIFERSAIFSLYPGCFFNI